MAQLEAQLGIKVVPCGIFIDELDPFLAATPDGIILNEDGLIELKCPYSCRNISPENAIQSQKLKFWRFDKSKNSFVVNKKHPYYYQIQGQLHIAQKQFCLFCVWTGQMHQLKVERIERDLDFYTKEMKPKLTNFYLSHMVPEIVDSRIKRNMPIRNELQK